MSKYYYRQRKKAMRVEKALARIKAEHDEMAAALREVVSQRERYLSDKTLYLRELPHCGCGTTFGGKILFTAGMMLECWEHCPEFTLPDGFKICRWGGGLSFSTGAAFNPETGEIRDYRNKPGFPRWRTLLEVSQPYRKMRIDGTPPPLCHQNGHSGT